MRNTAVSSSLPLDLDGLHAPARDLHWYHHQLHAADQTLRRFGELNNTYLWVRHTHAFTEGFLASDPSSEIGRLGITPEGRSEARKIGSRVAEALELCEGLTSDRIHVLHSDLPRAAETAECFVESFAREWKGWRASYPHRTVLKDLRERSRGHFEGQPGTEWDRIAAADRALKPISSMESPLQFLQRINDGVFSRCERLTPGQVFIIVSHTETMQAAQLLRSALPETAHYSDIRGPKYGEMILMGRPQASLLELASRYVR